MRIARWFAVAMPVAVLATALTSASCTTDKAVLIVNGSNEPVEVTLEFRDPEVIKVPARSVWRSGGAMAGGGDSLQYSYKLRSDGVRHPVLLERRALEMRSGSDLIVLEVPPLR